MEVYGSKEEFEKAKEARNTQKETRLEKRFEKKIKEMRQQVRFYAVFLSFRDSIWVSVKPVKLM